MSTGGGGSGGGGGSSGKVDWPSYLKNFHNDVLVDGITSGNDICIQRALYEAWDNSPFLDVAAYDPTGDLDNIQAAVDLFESSVSTLNPVTDWQSYLTAVLAQATSILNPSVWSTYATDANTTASTIVGTTKTDALVDAFEDAQKTLLNKNLARLANAFGDIDATSSSAHIFAKAQLFYEHGRDVARFRSEADLRLQDQRLQLVVNGAAAQSQLKGAQVQAILEAIREISRGRDLKLGAQQAVETTQIEASRIAIVAQKEQTDTEIELTSKDREWNLSIWGFAAELMAGIQGGVPGTQSKPKASTASVLGGAFSGAAAGALAGSAIPGIGTGFGAVIGGVSGFLGSQ